MIAEMVLLRVTTYGDVMQLISPRLRHEAIVDVIGLALVALEIKGGLCFRSLCLVIVAVIRAPNVLDRWHQCL